MNPSTLIVNMPQQPYSVYVGQGCLQNAALWKSAIAGHQIMIVTQEAIAQHYLNDLQQLLSNYQCDVHYLPHGEQYKTVEVWEKLMTALVEQGHERSTTLIALGGGMVGDMTGFAAACYQRGAHYIQVPTTLMAQVDASIGGKTGLNHSLGKNMIGAFYQPRCVISDINLLATLPEREYLAGIAEIIKYGLIADADFFAWLETHIVALCAQESVAVAQAIYTSIRLKAKIVSADERDQGLRHLLNFGHTFGHALEMLFEYHGLLHGEAVAIGIAMALDLSAIQGWLSEADIERVRRLLVQAGFSLHLKQFPPLSDFINALKRDKKIQQGQLHFILLKQIGQAEKVSVTEEQVREGLERFFKRGLCS